MIVCGISGEEPEQPVITPKGIIYEKRLIAKHLETDDKCPVTREDLASEDLVELRNVSYSKVTPPKASSIGTLIAHFQNEWDALMFENHSLQEQLQLARKELSENLYNHESAARIIVKLNQKISEMTEENEVLRRQMTHFGSADVPMTVDEPEIGVTKELTELIEKTATTLASARKEDKNKLCYPAPKSLPGIDHIKQFTCKHSNPIHAATSPGIKCMDLFANQHGQKIVSGGNDGVVVLFDKARNKVVVKMPGHGKPVSDVAINSDGKRIVSSSMDSTARLWTSSDESNYDCSYVTQCHRKEDSLSEVTSVAFHPAGSHFLSASLDKTWALHDMTCGKVVLTTPDTDPIVKMRPHPDGKLISTGSREGNVNLWDILSQQSLLIIEQGGPITSFDFSENGKYLAVSIAENVKLWDLRNPKEELQSIPFEERVSAVKFDDTGHYLSIGTGNAVQVQHFTSKKNLSPVFSLCGHEKPVTGCAFLGNVESLVSVSLDRMMKIWEP